MKYLVAILLLSLTVCNAQYTNAVWTATTVSNVMYTNRVAMTNMITDLNTASASNMNFVVSNTVWSITNAQGFTTNAAYLTLGSNIMYLKVTNGIVKVVTNAL
jgi:uncharacterized membrane protein YccF (DUF307 family)